ncbi:hypothetical protein ACTFIT_003275 [Dictyostelium discoideum]
MGIKYSIIFKFFIKAIKWSNLKVVFSSLCTFYDKRIIGEKSGGFLNTVVQIS